MGNSIFTQLYSPVIFHGGFACWEEYLIFSGLCCSSCYAMLLASVIFTTEFYHCKQIGFSSWGLAFHYLNLAACWIYYVRTTNSCLQISCNQPNRFLSLDLVFWQDDHNRCIGWRYSVWFLPPVVWCNLCCQCFPFSAFAFCTLYISADWQTSNWLIFHM